MPGFEKIYLEKYYLIDEVKKLENNKFQIITKLNTEKHKFLTDHIIEDEIIVPGVIFIEIFMQTASLFFQAKNGFVLKDFKIIRKIKVEKTIELKTSIVIQDKKIFLTISYDFIKDSRVIRKSVKSASAELTNLENTEFLYSNFSNEFDFFNFDFCFKNIKKNKIYQKDVLFHGPFFQGTFTEFNINKNYFFAKIINCKNFNEFIGDLVLLDNSFQLSSLWDMFFYQYKSLPVEINQLIFLKKSYTQLNYIKSIIQKNNGGKVVQKLIITDENNKILYYLSGFYRERIRKTPIQLIEYLE